MMIKGVLIFSCVTLSQANPTTDSSLAAFLSDVNQQLSTLYDQEQLALFRNELDGPNDLMALLQAELANEKRMSYLKSISSRVAKFKRLGWGDALQRRQLQRMPQPGYEALAADEVAQVYQLAANMSENYHNVKLCAYKQPYNCTLKLIPDVQSVVQQSRNLEEIEYYWLEWRRCTGLPTRQQFVNFMQLYKKTAKLNGFQQPADYWFRHLELSAKQAMSLLNELMSSLQPLFLQFHAHVRGSLRKMHGERQVPHGRPYPQQLSEIFLGNAFRRANAAWFVDIPSPENGLPNITEALRRRSLNTTQRVFWNVAEYYRGLGLTQLESSIWTYAQPVATHNEDQCWHKAWRFHTLSTSNFSYCPLNDEERLFSMFEAQFELHYFRAAAAQPMLLREEPFPNFVEALGKCFALAAASPRYLRKLGLVQGTAWSRLPARLNRLYLQGLRVIFLLPVFYVLDRYRVEVLSGHIQADDNEAYWRLTELFTGATAPRRRSNEHFDVPAKLLMEVDDQYTSEFLSIVLQFQLYLHFCNSSGQFVADSLDKPLDLCDLSDQPQIGDSLRRIMALGSSVHYKELLRQLLGREELSLDGLLIYFKPLQDWLTLQNRVNGLEVGWL
ncbi:angiotensin-converting enzyme [Drosophila grimshawi]|uniref:angiotensin-converting enzyme n=1 Tax=Drosophila grimshawi TaxID=7222 RepID=UPI001C934749|nr:angiotensin-converting enzyme [Drosophila grimshawi]